MVAGAYAKPCVSDVKLVADSVEDTAYGNEVRREAAQVNEAGKYEPKLTENGIPADVLAKLLPGDDVVELSEPVVGGGVAYRFVKRAFDVVSCGCALIVLAIPMGVIALKIKSESSGPVIYAQRRVGKGGKIFNVYKFRSMYTDAEARGALRQGYAQDSHGRDSAVLERIQGRYPFAHIKNGSSVVSVGEIPA